MILVFGALPPTNRETPYPIQRTRHKIFEEMKLAVMQYKSNRLVAFVFAPPVVQNVKEVFNKLRDSKEGVPVLVYCTT